MAFNDTDTVFMDRDYRFAEIVDRVGTGGPIRLSDGRSLPGEFLYGGEVVLIAPTFSLRGPLALHVFLRSTSTYIHAEDGEGGTRWVNRLGVKAAPQDLIDQLGPDACDCSPLVPITTRIEHWNAEETDPDRATAVVKRTRITAEMRGRDAVPHSRAGVA